MKSHNSLRFPGLVSVFLVCSLAGSAQWSKKPYIDWTEKDALKLLDDSPWGQTHVFASNTRKGVVPDRDADRERAMDQGGSSVSYISQINFHVRFLTAKPVRLAISRLYQIKEPGARNDQFAAKLKSFINEESPEEVIVSVFADGPRQSIKLQRARELLERLTTDDLKKTTYLVSGDRRVYLKEYQPPGPDQIGARLIFPRTLDGKPIAESQTGAIRFHSELSDAYALDHSFKLKNMVYEGKLEY
jgi:hypothetical protein